MKYFSHGLVLALLTALFFGSTQPTPYPSLGRLLSSTLDKECPSIPYFRPDDSNQKGGLSKSEQNSSSEFCPKVQTTCCSDSDFKSIKLWWQEDTKHSKSRLTRANLRKTKLTKIAALTTLILTTYLPHLKKTSTEITKDKSADTECSANALGISEFNDPNISDYSKEAAKCWKFTNTFQTT